MPSNKKEKKDLTEEIEALHAYERGEGVEPTDFTGNDAEVEMRYAQLMGFDEVPMP